MKIVLTVAAVVLFLSCRSAPVIAEREPFTWNRIPSGVLDAICAASIRSEGLGTHSIIHVVPRSQSLVSTASLVGLRRVYFVKLGKGLATTPQLAASITSELTSIPLDIPAAGRSCDWASLEHFDRARDRDKMILQVSAPFGNPYAKSEWGAFARLTVGGDAPAWFWVPLKTSGGLVAIGHAMPLDVEEH